MATTRPRLMNPRTLITTGLLLCLTGPRTTGRAETPSAKEVQALTERRALADGYHSLRDEVLQLKLAGGESLNDLAAEADALAVGIRRLVGQAKRDGRSRTYSSGDVEVTLRLDLEPFANGLLDLRRQVASTGPVTLVDLKAFAERSKGRWLTVVGHGLAPTRDDLTGPPGWPGGKKAGDLPPAGWAHVEPEGFRSAQRAAELDALESLLERIARLRMERSGTVQALIDVAPGVGEGLRQPFPGLRVSKPEWMPEQLCRLAVEVPITDLIARLIELRSAVNPPPRVSETDIRSIARFATKPSLRAVGYGMPPSSMLRSERYAVIDIDRPEWADAALTATSASALPELTEPTPRDIEIAIQDARIASRLKLAKQVDVLMLPGGIQVRDFLRHHEALAEDILTFLASARATGEPVIDRRQKRVTVTMQLPLRRLWLIARPVIPSVEVTTKPASP